MKDDRNASQLVNDPNAQKMFQKLENRYVGTAGSTQKTGFENIQSNVNNNVNVLNRRKLVFKWPNKKTNLLKTISDLCLC